MSTASAAAAAPSSAFDFADLKKQWDEKGYFVLKGMVNADKLQVLAVRLANEFARWKSEGFSGGGTLAGHLNCFPGDESRFVYEELTARGVIDLVKAIFPKAQRMPNVGMNFNLPGSVVQHYHADRPFTQEFPIVNIAVVKTVIENGAIDLLPGTNQQWWPYWKFALQRASRRSVRIEMEQGDVLVRSSNLWHRGMPNQSTVARPMMALTWEDGGSDKPDPFAWNEGKIQFRENWFKADSLVGRLRERMFVAAPITYDTFRFVRSLASRKGYDH